MTVFLLTADDEAAIKAALGKARTQPVPLDVLMQQVAANRDMQSKTVVKLEDRKTDPIDRHIEHIELPFGYRISISCEQQPAGLIAHFSMSSPRKGFTPRPETVEMVLKAADLDGEPRQVWLEEFEPGHFAVNVVVVLQHAIAGHA